MRIAFFHIWLDCGVFYLNIAFLWPAILIVLNECGHNRASLPMSEKTQFSLVLLFFYKPIPSKSCLTFYGVKMI